MWWSSDGVTKVMTLDATEFIRRFLLHTLPDGIGLEHDAISDTAAGHAPPGTGKAARGASWRRIAGLGATPAALHSALRCTGASATIYLHRPPAAQGRR
jgi:hypothetical protein